MPDSKLETLVRHWKDLRDQGTPVSAEQLCRDCPELVPALRQWLEAHAELAQPSHTETARGDDPEEAVRTNVLVKDPAERADAELSETLRRRLRLVTFILLLSWLPAIAAVYLLNERFEPLGTVLPELIVVPSSCVLLSRRRTWSLTQLRCLEVAIFASVVYSIASGQGLFYLDRRLAQVLEAGDDQKIVLLAAALAFPWYLVIIFYGFIPNTWRRCAAITGGMAVLSVALPGLGAHSQGLLGHPLMVICLVKLTLLMPFAVAIAVYCSFLLDQAQQRLVEAQQLGQYVLKRCLGKGGMGEVYLAEHQMLRRACAVKLIRRDRAASASYLQRFEREVRVLATLSHANIVDVYDYGVEADGTFYFVMEYLPGLTLHELVERFGPLPPARAVHLLRQMASALRAAHARGVIHRDIKPANVIICEQGDVADVVKLLDFGLVQVGLGKNEARLTQAGGVVGTPGFMSPEQVAGAPALDARSDIFSVGVLAYYLLTGQNPFGLTGVRPALAADVPDEAPPLRTVIPALDADLEDVVRRCLARAPADRFASAGALEKALAACRGASGWTAADADGWWREHGQARA